MLPLQKTKVMVTFVHKAEQKDFDSMFGLRVGWRLRVWIIILVAFIHLNRPYVSLNILSLK
jgi:hypothetical protein